MQTPDLSAEFCTLSPGSQIEVLLRLSHELTIIGRDTYEPSSPDLRNPHRLRYLNEVQHRITSHVLALLASDLSRYPDEVLASIILEQEDPELHRQIATAFARSLSSQAMA